MEHLRKEYLDQQISIEGEDFVREKIFLNCSMFNQMLELCTGNGWRGIGGVPWKKQADLRLAPTNGAGEKMSYLDINQQNVVQTPRYLPKLCLINWDPNCK